MNGNSLAHWQEGDPMKQKYQNVENVQQIWLISDLLRRFLKPKYPILLFLLWFHNTFIQIYGISFEMEEK